MARKNLKWQVHEAVMDSELPPPARLLMFVFADLANAETGEVPEERKEGTSIKELARRTGLDPATVKRRKRELIALGWLRYEAPDRKQQSSHETGDYSISIGKNPDPKPVKPVAQSAPPAEAQSAPPIEGQEGDSVAHSAPGGGAQCATPGAQSAPPIKGITDTNKTTTSLGPNADASAPKTGRKQVPKKKTDPEPHLPAEKLCEHLAHLMIRNGCKPPPITKAWIDAARLLLDKDGRDFDKAMGLLDWCQQDNFWKTNILSMPKFREKYDQLRLRANAEWEKTRNTAGSGLTTGQQRLAEAARIAADMRRLDEAEAEGTYQPPIMFALPPGRSA